MNFSDLEKTGTGEIIHLVVDSPITNLIIDSRKVVLNEGAVFFAIAGPRNNGHDYIFYLYNLGIRQFVIENKIDVKNFPKANFFLTNSSVDVLQAVAAFHRSQFTIPIIGITGSNGKTIIKEWLFQLLSPDHNIAKNPGSYNSQIGVPLSVWTIQSYHQLGIFEAGISR